MPTHLTSFFFVNHRLLSLSAYSASKFGKAVRTRTLDPVVNSPQPQEPHPYLLGRRSLVAIQRGQWQPTPDSGHRDSVVVSCLKEPLSGGGGWSVFRWRSLEGAPLSTIRPTTCCLALMVGRGSARRAEPPRLTPNHSRHVSEHPSKRHAGAVVRSALHVVSLTVPDPLFARGS